MSMDKEGYLFFKSRSKDIIIRGGANLYPAEIEAFMNTHPDIADTQVFGVSKNILICAYLIEKVLFNLFF